MTLSDQKLYCRVPTYTRLSKFQISLLETRALRGECAPIFLPLFDHLVSLAQSSYAAYTLEASRGHANNAAYLAQRAGRELFEARKTARYAVCLTCGQPIVNGTSRCSADASHVATVEAQRAAALARCCEANASIDTHEQGAAACR